MSWQVSGPPPLIADTTLRDGSHAHRHQYTADDVRRVARALDEGGVHYIEVSHGDGLSGSSIQYGFSRQDELELIAVARESVTRAKIAALLIPGIGTRQDLRAATDAGIQMVRVATLCTEADVSEEHFGLAKELGLETAGFLMMSHLRPPEVLAEQALKMEGYGADYVYIVDSAGAMLPQDAFVRVQALSGALTTARPGFHGHNNLGVAIGNTLAALDAGARIVDGTLRGYGAGAGNTATEVLAAVLERAGLNPGLDVFKLMDAAEFVLGPIQSFQPYPDRDSIAIGYAGVYSTFLLHAKRIGAELGVDPRDILIELGRRQTVAGQEDWIMRVALELKEAQQGAAV
ncbi:4-hydroxy-2-oxovalerate aldolase [Deinococcus sp.]|uniref:4-hydroxy-2-oxovalerate aldolase n=1 Tax=Deinococcus sp. TaxID=47478 RepID=UPI003B597E2D